MKEVKRIARDAAGGTRLAEDSGPEVLDRRAGRAAPLEDEVAAVAGEAFLDLGECRRPSRLQPRRSNLRCTRRAGPAGRRTDRTGVVCTVALDVAGVTRETIVTDYAQTGERPQAVLDRLSADPPGSWPSVGRRPPEEASRPEPGERREQDAAAGLRRAGDTYARSSPTRGHRRRPRRPARRLQHAEPRHHGELLARRSRRPRLQGDPQVLRQDGCGSC